jgi:hypothetical protein
MAYKNDISYILRQRFTIEFCVKLGKMGEKMLDILQSMYGTEAKAELQCFIGGTVFKTNKRVVNNAWRPSIAVTDVSTVSLLF